MNQTSDRVDFFDGLRGWAAVVVMMGHLSIAIHAVIGYKPIFHTPLRLFFDGGFSVFIFFVLSGVVLSLGYMKHQNLSDLAKLAVKRMPRLAIPVFVSSLLVYWMMKAGMMWSYEAASIQPTFNDWLNCYHFVPHFRDVINSTANVFLFGDSRFNSALWTMRGEFIGSYFVVILLLVLHFTKLKKAAVIWGGITLFLLIDPFQFRNYIARIGTITAAFSLGVFISYLYINQKDLLANLQKNTIIKTSIILTSILLYILNGVLHETKLINLNDYSKIMAFNAFLVVLSLILIDSLQRFFSCKISKFLGKISFPLYLVHMPIICSFTSFLIVQHTNTFSLYVLSIVLSLFVAYCFYPIEKLSIWCSQKICKFVIDKQEALKSEKPQILLLSEFQTHLQSDTKQKNDSMQSRQYGT